MPTPNQYKMSAHPFPPIGLQTPIIFGSADLIMEIFNSNFISLPFNM